MSAESVSRLAADAQMKQQQLGSTIAELKTRANPEALMADALDTASIQGQRLLSKTTDTVSAHPIAIGAAVAALGLALFTRSTLANATVDLGDGADYTDYDDSYDSRSYIPQSAVSQELASPSTPISLDSIEKAIAGNPVLSVVLGLAAGALLSAVTPKAK
ncbi:hypothetical protein GCM10007973_26130 [Polymorphobacter multimanifer]|nr:hypothetical protein GCM10007973_26130 [Polymorphobacter multimanifer]